METRRLCARETRFCSPNSPKPGNTIALRGVANDGARAFGSNRMNQNPQNPGQQGGQQKPDQQQQGGQQKPGQQQQGGGQKPGQQTQQPGQGGQQGGGQHQGGDRNR